MVLCCQRLQTYYEEKGKRGITVLVDNNFGEPIFCLQARPCDYTDESRFAESLPEHEPYSFSFRTQIGLSYCPFCGYDLRKWLRKNKKLAEEMMEECNEYLIQATGGSRKE